ncbi:MAG: hypothetical protein O4M80_05070, partial [Buchnera aphidicola]|nr:hypothetical protein [Buchnera aphidicola]
QLKKNTVNKNKKISECYSDVVNTTKNIQLNKESWQSYTEEKKDYHVTTFLHARQAEDDSDQAVEIDKKNRGRNIKNYRSKKIINKYY